MRKISIALLTITMSFGIAFAVSETSAVAYAAEVGESGTSEVVESSEETEPSEESETSEAVEPSEESETSEAVEPSEESRTNEAAETTEESETNEAAEAIEVSEPAEADETAEESEPAEADETAEESEPAEADETAEESEAAEAAESAEAAGTTDVSEAAEAAETTDVAQTSEVAVTSDEAENSRLVETPEGDHVDLNSGAERNGEFITVNEGFQTENEALTLIMCGLKNDNKDLLLAALSQYFDANGDKGLKVVDDAFPDAEKWSDDEDNEYAYDDGHCWAAAASNMLWISGWAEKFVNPDTGVNFASEDEVFGLFNQRFSDAGGQIDRAIDWFFMGEFYMSAARPHASLFIEDPEDGFMKSFVSSLAQQKYDLIADPAGISQLERIAGIGGSPAVFQTSLGVFLDGRIGSSGHTVMSAGVIIDPQASSIEDRYKGIAIIDSDNDATPSREAEQIVDPTFEQMQADKAARTNSCTFYPLRYTHDDDGVSCWEIVGYSEGETYILYSINALELPSEELIEKCTETEGTCSVADTVDLTMESVITTDETEPITDSWQFGLHRDEYTCTEFQSDQPVDLNYFVVNRSSIELNKEYTEGKDLSIGWKVTRDSDGTVVAEGMDAFELPLCARFEYGAMSYLNQKDGELVEWEPGTYTVTVSLNPDHAVREAYYLNNIDESVTFTIIGNDRQDEEDESGESSGSDDESENKDTPAESKTPEESKTSGETEISDETEIPEETTALVGSDTPEETDASEETNASEKSKTRKASDSDKDTPNTGDAASDRLRDSLLLFIASAAGILALLRLKGRSR